MSEREGSSSFLVGFIIGAVAGVALGFLYAPKPGRETRELLKHKAGEVTEKIKSTAKEAGKKAKEKLSPGEA